MINTLIGQKLDQAQTFLENGKRIPVTEIALSDNVVLQVKTPEKDSYSSVQLGTGSKKKANKAYSGHAKKSGSNIVPSKIKEVRLSDSDIPELGSAISVETVFKPGDIIQVTGVSKGKGFAGGVKRHNFSGGPKTHGQSDRHRAPGSIGQGTTPGRVYRGKRMAGRMGSDTVTVKNLRVIDIDIEKKMLYVGGLVPGHKNSWVYITVTGEDKKFVPVLKEKTEEKEEEVVVKDEIKAEEKTETPEEKVEAASAPSIVDADAIDADSKDVVKSDLESSEVEAEVKEEAASDLVNEESKDEVKAEVVASDDKSGSKHDEPDTNLETVKEEKKDA